MTIAAAAKFLGIPKSSMAELIYADPPVIVSSKPRGRRLVLRSSLVAYLESGLGK
jgi:Helix-turn-helix domain